MEIRIFGLADDSIVDGPGVRYTVFVQGCPHHCPGCHNPASHDFAGGTLMDTDGIIRKIGENPLLDGVTLSGGEPMCQPEACRTIANAAHAKHLNDWCYTGFTLDALLKESDPARMALLHVVGLTRALGERLSPEGTEPEVYRWRDPGDSHVTAEFEGGRLARWRLERPAEPAGPADGEA